MKTDLVVRARGHFLDLGRQIHKRTHWLVARSDFNVTPDAIAFQDPIDEICEAPPPRFMRSTLYVILSAFVISIVVASLVKVDVVIVGTGRLATDAPSILLQPMDRGIIRELKVKAGDTVTRGEVLATLDPTFTEADLVSLTAQQRSVLAKLHRIEAELNGKEFVVSGAPNPDELVQATLYRQRQAQFKSRLRVLDEDIGLLQARMRTLSDDKAALSKQLEIAKDVEGMRAALMQSQSGSKLQYLDAQSVRMRMERDQQDAVNHLPELQHDMQAKEAERQAFIDEWTGHLLEDLVATRNEVAKLGEGMAKASRMNDLVVVTAPQDGVVLDVAKRSVGSVVSAAEPLITIVPANASLVGDITINSSDVGYTKPGDSVLVKVDAFPYQIHGGLPGRLRFVSEESTMIDAAGLSPTPGRSGGNAVHRGEVDLLSTKLEHLPEGAMLIPGMTLSAEIKVGARSVLSYFLSPLTRGLSESMREP